MIKNSTIFKRWWNVYFIVRIIVGLSDIIFIYILYLYNIYVLCFFFVATL